MKKKVAKKEICITGQYLKVILEKQQQEYVSKAFLPCLQFARYYNAVDVHQRNRKQIYDQLKRRNNRKRENKFNTLFKIQLNLN